MPREEDFASPDGFANAAGNFNTGARASSLPRKAAGEGQGPGGTAPQGRPPRSKTLVRILASGLVCLLLFSAAPAILSSAGLHFGLVSAVKSKVKELGKKVRDRMAPRSLSAVALSSTTVHLSWKDTAKDEDGFKIERRVTAAGSYFQLAVTGPGASSYLDAGLTAGTTYYYRVRAYAGDLFSSYSNEASAVTPLPGTGPGATSINSLTTSVLAVSTGASTTLTCSVTNPGSLPLTYTWNPGSGTISGSGASVTWTAPVSSGNYTAACSVSDGAGGGDSRELNILVVFPSDISFTLSVSPPVVPPGGASVITSSVTMPDPNLVALTYTWEAASGTLSGAGSAVTWTAPNSTGAYTIFCAVEDGTGDRMVLHTDVYVATGPVITALIADPGIISTGAVSGIICVATAAAGSLTYTWSADSGTIAGSTEAVTWTAPESTGAYTVTVEVADGLGGTDSRSLSVLVNNPPVITAFAALPEVIEPNSVSTVTCLAYDPDGAPVTYTWSAGSGTIADLGGGQMAWTAPDSTGTYTVNCEISDGGGGLNGGSLQIIVASGPVITSLTAAPPFISTGAAASVICVATAPAGDSLTYTWTAASGTIAGSTATVTWTAPESTGSYTVTVEVADGLGGTFTRSLSVLVDNPPVITAFAAQPGIVEPLEISTITCLAYDPDGGALAYTWSATSGTIAEIGAGQIAWTAPDATGTYTVSCDVSDGGRTTSSNLQVLVASAPVITSLTASPIAVATGAVSSVVCVATSAAASLTYTWSAASGTISGAGDTVAWTAPASTGVFTVTVRVSDPEGRYAEQDLSIRANNPPVLAPLSASPPVVGYSGISTITASAFDPDNGPVTYAWSAASGTIAGIVDGQVRWTAPDATGTYTISCEAADDQGATVRRDVQVLVASAPVITSFTASPISVSTGADSILVCVATSAAAGSLSYSWTPGSGTITGTGDSVTWTAPPSTGVYTISVQVSDDFGGTAAQSLSVRANNPPVLAPLLAAPPIVNTLEISTITASAYEPDGGTLTYTWSATSGTIADIAPGQIGWTAPDSTGTYTISCQAADELGAVALRSVQVIVASAPIITSLTASPASVSTGAASNLVCVATSAAASLTYTWDAASGSIVGSGETAVWTAPVSTGVFTVGIRVSDPEGRFSEQELSIRANNPPVLAPLLAAPPIVNNAGISTITASAYDPDGGPITYTWSANSGTVADIVDGQVRWTAPDATGTYTVSCEAADEFGATARYDLQVIVASEPVITSFTASPAAVSTGAVSNVVCIATSAAASLTYTWNAASGTIVGNGNTAAWTAPDTTGVFTVSVTVADAAGRHTERELSIRANNPPVLAPLSAVPPIVNTLEISTVTAAAYDPDGGAITYTWSANSGTIADIAPGQIGWTAPDSTGTYTVSCEVADDQGATARRDLLVVVASAPIITVFTASPTSVSTGAASNLVCVATSAAASLTYTWDAASGTIAGNGETAVWTAPVSTGVFTVSVSVSDAAGRHTEQELSIRANNPPVLAPLSAVPPIVNNLEISTITAAAYDPDGGAITYTWSATSGTIADIAPGQIGWTAPDSTGTYTVSCEVADDQGATARRDLLVVVASAPIITSFTASPTSVSTGAASNLVCVATSAAASLTYTWDAASGTIVGNGETAVWTAPVSTGVFTVSVSVSDAAGRHTGQELSIRANNPPVLAPLSAAPPIVANLEVATITASAYDPDAGVLTYTWSADSGTIADIAAGQIGWTAPDSTGSYTISCEVADDQGATARRDILVVVASAPIITSFTASP
ncbi:MAG TPA: hypothetical protein DEQ38_00335, partial [Elusimicrobia bacterium]|nr:hypothetical protein [Elusimicrobiota bacterium]